MNDNRYYAILALIQRNIQYYIDVITLYINPFQRMVYESQLYNVRMSLNYWKNKYYHCINYRENQSNIKNQPSQQNFEQIVFTVEQLAQYDGSNGKPAYVGINGIVYDVSLEATWGGGTHFGLYAGKDLSDQFNSCHDGGRSQVLIKLPKVGII